MKKCFSVIAALLCLISLLPTAAFAQENSTSVYGCIDLANIDEASNVEVSDIMTYDEMVAYYAESKGISLKAAQVALGAPQGDISTCDIAYRTYSVILQVKGNYKPRIEFYCEVAYGGHFWNIYSIYSIELVRKSGSLVKKFDGTIDAWLRGAYQIEYKINGDFYNYATKEVSGTLGGEIKLGEHGSISFSLSGASSNNFYAYCYEHKTAEFTSY